MRKGKNKFTSLMLLFTFICSFSGFFTPSASYAAVTVPTALEANKKISAGYFHSLALKPNGCVTAWGYNEEEQCNIPANALSKVVALATGDWHSLALKSNGNVIAWGDNLDGQCNIPKGLNNITAIAAGGNHSLALKADGSIVAWGRNFDGQCNVPKDLKNVIAIAAGSFHSMALKSDGSIAAWGRNSDGQCDVPKDLNNVIAIAAGESHSLALKSDGTVIAWGLNNYNQCNVPEDLSDIVAIAAGGFHSLALNSDGKVMDWGIRDEDLNNDGRYKLPPSVQNDVVAIAAGQWQSLALKSDGNVIAWGDNGYGQCIIPKKLNLGVTTVLQNIFLTIGQKTATVNGKIKTMDVEPYIDANTGKNMVPLRFVSEALGAEVDWISTTEQVIIKDGNKEVILTIGSNNALVNGQKTKLDCVPCLMEPGRTFVSLEFVKKTLGAKVEWNNLTGGISISRG